MREAPPQVIKALVTVDGHDHIAWGALRSDLPDTPALGVVTHFVTRTIQTRLSSRSR